MRARSRVSRGLEPFPSKNALKRFLDYLMYVVGICAPIALVPQILQIYSTHSAVGISLLTWILLACINMLWAFYGVVHKDKHIIFANAFMVLFDLALIIGILLY